MEEMTEQRRIEMIRMPDIEGKILARFRRAPIGGEPRCNEEPIGVRMDDRAVGWGTSIARAAGYAVSSILMIGFIWIAVDRRHQGFHDKLARTFVVYDAPE